MSRKGRNLASEAATVRIGNTLAIPAVLTRFGVDASEVLAQCGLESTLFDDPDNRISFARRSRLIELCVSRTGCTHFGLLVGARAGLESLGVLGLLMKYAPDVASALRSLESHLRVNGAGGAVTLGVHGNLATLGYQIHLRDSVATDQIGDGAVAMMFNLLRALCGDAWTPAEVWFAHRRPGDVAPFQRLFRVPVRFDAEQNAVVFRAEDLKRRLPLHDPALHRLLQRQVDVLEAAQGDDLPAQVRVVLRTALSSGQASVGHVAAAFSMHGRTLNRRLRACDTNLRRLVGEARYEIARQMLGQSSMDVRQIALLLGYADSSAFARAFRRWSGMTPAAWRKGLDLVPS